MFVDYDNASYLRLINYIRTHHYLSDKQFEEFDLYDDLLYDFNRLKCDMHHRASFFNYNIISLGENCLPITVLTKWGLDQTPAQKPGKKRLPFDLAFTPLKEMIRLIRTKFNNYSCDSIINNYGGYSIPIFRNTKLGITFNHDRVNEQIGPTNNFRYINDILKQRVIDFYDAVKADNNIFVLNIAGAKDVTLLLEIDLICRKELHAELLILSDTAIPDVSDLNYKFCPLPYPDYYWPDNKHNFSDAGFDYEFHIAEYVINYIESNFERKMMPIHNQIKRVDMDKLYLQVCLYCCDIEEYSEAIQYYKEAQKYSLAITPLLEKLRNRINNACKSKMVL